MKLGANLVKRLEGMKQLKPTTVVVGGAEAKAVLPDSLAGELSCIYVIVHIVYIFIVCIYASTDTTVAGELFRTRLLYSGARREWWYLGGISESMIASI